MNLLNIYTVSFFGHRDFSEHLRLELTLENMLKDILTQHEYVVFLVGRNGEFDQFVSSTIRKVKRDFCRSNSELVCVLPYETSEFKNNVESFLKYYDRVEISSPANSTHFKAAISKRNIEMVSRSNLLISYVNKKAGGAYNAVRFAQKNNIPFINLAENNI
ncbi:MAG: hypothetical protein J6E38_01335 [Clostridia bacterium]|nr:hypothetical protein [Clostridia bacterium]